MRSIFLLFLVVQSQDIDAEKAKLERLKKEFEESKRKISQMEVKVKSTEEEIKKIERQEREIERFIEKLNMDIREIRNDIAKLEIQISQKEAELNEHSERIKFSLNFLYQTLPQNDLIRFLPGNENEKEAIYLLDYVIQSEKKSRDEALELYKELTAYKKLKEENLDFYVVMKNEVEEQEKNLENLRKKRQILLTNLKKQKEEEEKRLAELEKAIKEMQNLVARLEKEAEKKRKEEHVAAKSPEGKYPWPVKGRIVMEYGTILNPKYNTRIFNPGIDIEADPGSPVICIDDGVVIFSGVVTGYGNTVIVDHGGFFSVYAYLETVSVTNGTKVKRGQIIGKVGGPSHYFGSKLHFEIRDRGKAINPLTYLQ